MSRSARSLAVVFLLSGMASQAGETNAVVPSLSQGNRIEWRHVGAQMSAQEYRTSSRYNKRVFGDATREVFEDTLMSFGIPKQGVEVTGAAVGLAIQGAKVDLNESETLSLEVDEVVSDDRSIYFNLKLDW